MRNLKLKIQFVGTSFVGWQVQKNGISVMEKIQDAIEKITGIRSDVKGCSRTDSGVHANQYVLSFKTHSTISVERFPEALNTQLPYGIAVLTCEEMEEDFHARYSCIGKEYLYKIHLSRIRNSFLENRILEYPQKLDLEKMKKAQSYFVGTHDFRAFCSTKTDQENTTRTIWWVESNLHEKNLNILIAGDGFLFNMVRIIVGTLLWVGTGRIEPDRIPFILESKSRNYAGVTVPAHGLYLNQVFYQESEVRKYGQNP